MTATNFIGCSGVDRIEPYAYYRLTLRIPTIVQAITPDAAEDADLRGLYSGIQDVSDLVSSSPYARASGEGTIVIDAKAKGSATQTVAQTAREIDGYYAVVDLVSMEKLSGAAAVSGGAAARQAIVDQTESARSTFSSTVGDVVGETGNTLKWGLIAVVIVVAIVLLKDAEEWI